MRLVMFVYRKPEKTSLKFGKGSNSRRLVNSRRFVAVVKRYAAGALTGGAAGIIRGWVILIANRGSTDQTPGCSWRGPA